MSTSEILAELPKLSKFDREVITLKIAELDNDGWADADGPLSDSDKAIIKDRITAYRADPATSIPWKQFDETLSQRLGE